MISDVLSDAVSHIEEYLTDEPNYVYAEEIRVTCVVMDKMRGLLDNPNPSRDQEAEFRRLTAAAKVYDASAALVESSATRLSSEHAPLTFPVDWGT